MGFGVDIKCRGKRVIAGRSHSSWTGYELLAEALDVGDSESRKRLVVSRARGGQRANMPQSETLVREGVGG